MSLFKAVANFAALEKSEEQLEAERIESLQGGQGAKKEGKSGKKKAAARGTPPPPAPDTSPASPTPAGKFSPRGSDAPPPSPDPTPSADPHPLADKLEETEQLLSKKLQHIKTLEERLQVCAVQTTYASHRIVRMGRGPRGRQCRWVAVCMGSAGRNGGSVGMQVDRGIS